MDSQQNTPLEKQVPRLRPLDVVPFVENGQQMMMLRDPEGISESMLAVSPDVLMILGLFDGHKNLAQIASEIQTPDGQLLPVEEIFGIYDMLNQSFFLINDDFFKFRKQVIENYKSLQNRPMAVMNNGFPQGKEEFEKYLNGLLYSEDPEDFEPEDTSIGRATGLLLPHIDFNRGGATYGRGYRKFLDHLPSEEEGPLLIGIIGVAHVSPPSPVIFTNKNYVTPSGILFCNQDAIEILKSNLKGDIFENEFAHKSEHSIEMQAVWIKYLLQDREVEILPILAGNIETITSSGYTPTGNQKVEEIISALKAVENAHPGPVIWIASVDFAHIGPRFGDKILVDDKQCLKVEKQDYTTLKTLHSADPELWWESVKKDNNSRRICGLAATYLMLRLIKNSTGYILDYQQALSEEKDQMVSYAAGIFIEPEA